jgi:hypothetical protein
MPARYGLLVAALAAAGCHSPEPVARPCLGDQRFVRSLERSLTGRERSPGAAGAGFPVRLIGDSALCRQALAGLGAGHPGPREAGYVFHLEGELQGYAVAFPPDSTTFYVISPTFEPRFTVSRRR